MLAARAWSCCSITRAERYALTVIDCGTLAREADQIALASATHVAWVLPATAGAASRGRQLLDAIAPHQSGREILVARHEPRDRRRALRELRDLAQTPARPVDPPPERARARHGQRGRGA